MSLDANKALVRRFYAEVINDRDVDAIDRLLTEGFVHNGEARGRAGQQLGVRASLDAFPDLRNEVLIAQAWDEGDYLGLMGQLQA